MKLNRVVITGLGVVAPNGVGTDDFLAALQNGVSGLKHIAELEKLAFSCQVAGIPPLSDEKKSAYFNELTLKVLKSSGIIYGCIAGTDAWKHAGLSIDTDGEPDWDAGCIFGTGLSGVEPLREAIYQVDEGNVRRLGSRVVEQTMASGISAYLGGMLGLGNHVTSNSAACSTGTESILMAYERIASGKARIMLAGSCDSHGPYIWGGFDSMRVLNRNSNNAPEKASRPMSATAAGFIPGAGAGALVLEELEHAKARGAVIYAEVLGGAVNSGGQRQGGTMTAPNSTGVVRCLHEGMKNAGITPDDIDAICGHLTSTMGDVLEIKNWVEALNRKGNRFPYINSLKSMVGHCLAAAGSIEMVAAVLQLYHGFLHANLNIEDLHPEIAATISSDKIPVQKTELPGLNIIAKSSFGFGDVNACVFLKKY